MSTVSAKDKENMRPNLNGKRVLFPVHKAAASRALNVSNSTQRFLRTQAQSSQLQDDLCNPSPKIGKRKRVVRHENLNRNLFKEHYIEVNRKDSETDYSQIEQSEIVGFESHDDDIYSEDDNDSEEILNEASDQEVEDVASSNNQTVPKEYATLGKPLSQCPFCKAFMWNEERVNKGLPNQAPVFSICCRKEVYSNLQ
ncbi:hypothetical protein ACET3Z_023367 [Daucus carota]